MFEVEHDPSADPTPEDHPAIANAIAKFRTVFNNADADADDAP